jgi:Fe-S cluster biogenesis protein NfuA/nitrite reductase/ring-hydroxylating ferredoxin subunit
MNAPFSGSSMSHRDSTSLSAELNQHGKRVQELIAEIDGITDANARELLQECIREVLAFHGLGLGRVLEVAKDASGSADVYEKLVDDSIVRGLLLIHGLHPVPLEARLRQALEKVRPYMESHGGNVELLSLDNDVARLQLVGHCKSCPSSAVTLELALKQAIEEACPDLLNFECEGVAEAAKRDEVHIPNAAPSWTELDDGHDLAEGGLLSVSVAGIPLVLCKTEGRLYAYRNRCPACNMPLHLGTLNRALLRCRAGHCYDIQRAGRAIDSADLHLDPFPLLASGGFVKVALPIEHGALVSAKQELAPAR